jgi:ABC-type Fe3+/spermidine/putrescine transport system ATPase subunit
MSLILKHIRKSYPEFDLNLSFTAEKGELLTLLGPSGCGKTTTLHLIAGFIEPETGSLLIDGEDVTHTPPHLRNLGVVFQDYALFPNMRVFGNVAFGLRMHGWTAPHIHDRVHSMLDLVRLTGYENRFVTQLSGGEQQRVALARALAPEPRLLLLDEPLSALDAKLRRDLRLEIKRIQRELNLTTVYVTHDQEEALAISDSIVVMQQGSIEQIGTPFELFNRPRSSFVADFMGMPNRIEGNVQEIDGRSIRIHTDEGPFYAQYTKPISVNEPVVLVFRPEKCTPIEDSDDVQHTNLISGNIMSCEYLGEFHNAVLRTEQGEYTVKMQHTAAPRVGAPVRLRIRPEDLWILGG